MEIWYRQRERVESFNVIRTQVGSADVRDWQMAGALRQPPVSPGCG